MDDKSGELLRELEGHQSAVACAAFSADGRYLTMGGIKVRRGYKKSQLPKGGHSIRIWDVQTGRQLIQLKGHSYAVAALACFPNSEKLVSGSSDGSIRVWDVSNIDRTETD